MGLPTMTEIPPKSLSAAGVARATVAGSPLSPDELQKIDAYWSACKYLALGMIYLQANPLLREPLKPEHIKSRLLGHWGSSPGLAFIYTHLSRIIRKHDAEMIFLAGPGHGAPGVLAPVYLEGTYSQIYPDKSQDERGLREFFKQFSFPGGIGSHCTPETPGSIHEGGELGYVLSHACGAAFDNPNLIVAAVVGDGEAETGPLATSWHISKFLNPIRDGAVLPILHLNGYKINNPTLLARISHEELEDLLRGYGWNPYFVEGSEHESMHQAMAATMERCMEEISAHQDQCRKTGVATRPRWPMVVLRSPKGWGAPVEVDGNRLEGFWRSHQVPLADVKSNRNTCESLRMDALLQAGRALRRSGKLTPGDCRTCSGGHKAHERQPARQCRTQEKLRSAGLPRLRNQPLIGPAKIEVGECAAARCLPSRRHELEYRIISGVRSRREHFQQTGCNLPGLSKKFWIAEKFSEDRDGTELAADGRVVEMLSEHTMEGMLEGYLLTGRNGFLSSYEAFVHVIDSMFNQHAKWLSICNNLSWRRKVASLNLLITSTVWRQDHNGFTHQDPGFLDVVLNKSAAVTRIYLPPDANCLLSVADHCLRSENYINVIVSDKQKHLQFLDIDAAITHCTKGIGIWKWASNDEGSEPDVVMAAAGDIPTQEALAAAELLRGQFPDLKIRFVNVVDLFKLQPSTEHPHGLTDADFDALFTTDKPIIFNFHGYPWLIHRLAYRRTNHRNLHVRGYKEKGNINTPMELAINNQTDRFSLAIDAIDRVPKLQRIGSHAKEAFRDKQIACQHHAYEYGIDSPEISGWKWQSTR